jgi:hypothetical protein
VLEVPTNVIAAKNFSDFTVTPVHPLPRPGLGIIKILSNTQPTSD